MQLECSRDDYGTHMPEPPRHCSKRLLPDGFWKWPHYRYDPAHQYLALYAEVGRNTWTQGKIRLDGFGVTGIQKTVQNTGPETVVAYLKPPATAVPGQIYVLDVVLSAWSSTGLAELWMSRPVIVAGLGNFTHAQYGV